MQVTDYSLRRHDFMQQTELLGSHFSRKSRYASKIPARMAQACNESAGDRIEANAECYGNYRRRVLGCLRSLGGGCSDDGHAPVNQVGRHCSKLVCFTFGKAVFDAEILTLDE